MGFEKLPQFQSRNGCVYIFNHAEMRWYEICPCPVNKLPVDVITQVKETQEKADELKDSLK